MLIQFEKKFDQVDIRFKKDDEDVSVVDLYVSGEAEVYEENYGEDADGNRGMLMRTVEDVKFHQITAVTENGDMIEIQFDMIEVDEAKRIEAVCEDIAYQSYGE